MNTLLEVLEDAITRLTYHAAQQGKHGEHWPKLSALPNMPSARGVGEQYAREIYETIRCLPRVELHYNPGIMRIRTEQILNTAANDPNTITSSDAIRVILNMGMTTKTPRKCLEFMASLIVALIRAESTIAQLERSRPV